MPVAAEQPNKRATEQRSNGTTEQRSDFLQRIIYSKNEDSREILFPEESM